MNTLEIQYWIAEANKCEERWRRDVERRNNYPFLVNYYEGVEKVSAEYPRVSSASQYSIIEEYFPNTNSIISDILYQYPDIITEATKPDAMNNERLMKSALSYGFKKCEAIVENRLALFDMIFSGYCCVEVGHTIENNEGMAYSVEESQESQGMMSKMVNGVKEFFSSKEVEEEEAKKKPTKDSVYAATDNTYIRRWSPLCVPLDHKAETLRDRRYNLKKIWLSKAEFDAQYPAFKGKVFGGDKEDKGEHDENTVLLYEFQIRRKGNEYHNLIIAPCYTKSEIAYTPRPYTTNGFNMKIGTLHKYGKLYPISLAQKNKKIQDEMNNYVRFQMEVAERNIPKYVATDGLKADGETALRSSLVNDIVKVSRTGDVSTLPATNLSIENKELLALFDRQKTKNWSVSDSRLAGQSNSQFMGEIEIQEQGFQSRQVDLQEGLRALIRDELDTLKDIQVTYWDGEYFFKVTGGAKPEWYIPQVVPNPVDGKPMVMNALTDILTGDYEIDIDISSSQRPNKEIRKKAIIEYLTWITSPAVAQYLLSQGKTINLDEFKKSASEFGFNADTIFVDMPMPALPAAPGAMPEEVPPNVPV